MKGVRRISSLDGYLLKLWMFLFLSALGSGQTASLRGQVVDQSGEVIPKSTVTLTAASGVVKTTTAAENGSYSFQALPPGQYTVRAAAPKLEQEPVPIVLKPGAQTLRLELKVAAVQQQTTIQENTDTSVSTESANNASAVVLRGKDLESLADDPEDLGADLQALAGPSAGPGGSSIFIDGFRVAVSFHRKTPSAKSGSIRIPFRLNTISSATAESRS